jgi:hypothetical protein
LKLGHDHLSSDNSIGTHIALDIREQQISISTWMVYFSFRNEAWHQNIAGYCDPRRHLELRRRSLRTTVRYPTQFVHNYLTAVFFNLSMGKSDIKTCGRSEIDE